MGKPQGKGWRPVKLWTINNIVIPWHPVVPHPHQLIPSIPTKSKFFTVTDLHSAFFSISVDETGQYLSAFTWEGKQFTWTVMPQGFTESPYFLQILKADLIQSSPEAQLCCNMCMICFFAPFQASSQEDCVQVVALLALKGQKVAQNFLVCPNPGSVFIAYDIWTRASPRYRQASNCPKFSQTQNEVPAARLSWAC